MKIPLVPQGDRKLFCWTDGGVLAKFDADGEYLDEEMDFTFDDFSMPEEFAELAGFNTKGN